MDRDTGAVLITGACGNLGRAVADRFSARKLVLLDRDMDQLRARFGTEGPARALVGCDLRDASAVSAALQGAREHVGPITVVCNVAGGFRMGEAVHETSEDTWDFLLDLNARSVLHTARAAVPGMIEAGGGAIVNVAAGAAMRGVAGMGAYCASKSAVVRLTESMAAELRERGINANCVLPSIIDTPENRRDMPKADVSRWVAPTDIAAVIAFLASTEARAIHGASIPVSGLS